MDELKKLAHEGLLIVNAMIKITDISNKLSLVPELKDILSKIYNGFKDFRFDSDYWYELDSLVYQVLTLVSMNKIVGCSYELVSLASSLLQISEKCVKVSKSLSEKNIVDSEKFIDENKNLDFL